MTVVRKWNPDNDNTVTRRCTKAIYRIWHPAGAASLLQCLHTKHTAYSPWFHYAIINPNKAYFQLLTRTFFLHVRNLHCWYVNLKTNVLTFHIIVVPSVGAETAQWVYGPGLWAGHSGVRIPAGIRVILFPKCPDSLGLTGTLLAGSKATGAWGVTHLHLHPKLRTNGAIPPSLMSLRRAGGQLWVPSINT